MWESDFPLFNKDDNSAEYGINNKTKAKEKSYFDLEYLHILELIPKEQFDSLKHGINKFKSKHGGSSVSNHGTGKGDYFKFFSGGDAYSSLENVAIKEESTLYPYIAQIHFRLINITDSFCCLSAFALLNKDLKCDISNFITSNVKCIIDVGGFEGKKWYQFKNLGNSGRRGTVIKQEQLEEILTDIKWRVTKEMHKFIPAMILSSHKVNLPSVSSFRTNIDGNSYPEFWQSLEVSPELCDFTNDYSGCISWGSATKNISYIYSNSKELYSEILAVDIDMYLCQYLIAEAVNDDLRNHLVAFSKKMSAITNKNIKHWLKLKIQVDSILFYYIRFIDEYHIIDTEFSNFVSLKKERKSIIQNYYDGMNRRIEEAQKLYTNIMRLFQSNSDYRNVKENYKIQKLVLLTTGISVLVAIIALFVTVKSNTEIMQKVNTIWNYIVSLFNEIKL